MWRQSSSPLHSPTESPLGEGETAKVYAWHEGTVLKIFRPGVLRSEIEAEARATKVAHSLGAGAPDVGEVVDIDGSLGLVFERVSGQSMLNRLIQKPEEAERLAMVLADLHAHIHSCTAPPEMPSQAHLLQLKVGRTDIPAELATRISGALAASISERSLCHGDFHPANIMLDGDKAFVIDWNDAARGNPALDVARTTVVVLGAALERPQLLRDRAEVIEAFHAAYLSRYFSRCPDRRTQYEHFLPIAAAGRLSECGEGARAWLLQLADKCSGRPV